MLSSRCWVVGYGVMGIRCQYIYGCYVTEVIYYEVIKGMMNWGRWFTGRCSVADAVGQLVSASRINFQRVAYCHNSKADWRDLVFSNQRDADASVSANGRAAFSWKLPYHWLKGLRQRQFDVVINTGPLLAIAGKHWGKMLSAGSQDTIWKLSCCWLKSLGDILHIL